MADNAVSATRDCLGAICSFKCAFSTAEQKKSTLENVEQSKMTMKSKKKLQIGAINSVHTKTSLKLLLKSLNNYSRGPCNKATVS